MIRYKTSKFEFNQSKTNLGPKFDQIRIRIWSQIPSICGFFRVEFEIRPSLTDSNVDYMNGTEAYIEHYKKYPYAILLHFYWK